MDIHLQKDEYCLDEETGEISFDAEIIEDDISYYSEAFMSMVHQDDCNSELEDFGEDEIKDYAEYNLDMVESRYALEESEDYDLCKEVESRGYTILERTQNDIITQDLIGRFIYGFDSIGREELETLLNKFGL